MEDIKQNPNSYWVCKIHSVVPKYVKIYNVLGKWFRHLFKLQVRVSFTEETI